MKNHGTDPTAVREARSRRAVLERAAKAEAKRSRPKATTARVALARALCSPWGRDTWWRRFDPAALDHGAHIDRELRKADLILGELAAAGLAIVRAGG